MARFQGRSGFAQPLVCQQHVRRYATTLPIANALNGPRLVRDTETFGNLGRAAKGVYARRVPMKFFHLHLHLALIKHHV